MAGVPMGPEGKAMTNTTQDYDRYWREHAQFFPPCDKLAGESLEPFKAFGAHLHEEVRAEFEQAVNIAVSEKEAIDERYDYVRDAFEELKRSLRVAVEESDADTIKVKILQLVDAA